MSWQAKSKCAKHYCVIIKRIINTLPISYLLPPSLGEIFNGLDNYNRRLRGYALIKGFNIIKYGGGTKVNLNYEFKYIFYGINNQNYYKLEDYIIKNSNNIIINKR